MKSAIYNVSSEDNKPRFYLVVYDETMPCVLCGLPVLSASFSSTAICGWCDCGRPREGTEAFRREVQRRHMKGRRITPAEAWGNKTQDFLFNSREEANQKMIELHQTGIEGFPHIVTAN